MNNLPISLLLYLSDLSRWLRWLWRMEWYWALSFRNTLTCALLLLLHPWWLTNALCLGGIGLPNVLTVRGHFFFLKKQTECICSCLYVDTWLTNALVNFMCGLLTFCTQTEPPIFLHLFNNKKIIINKVNTIQCIWH